MKDSGVAWLGDIPAEWNIKPLFSFVEEKKNKNSENLVDNVLSLSYGMIKKRELDNGGLLPESFATYQIVEADDIILRLTDLQNDKRSLRVGRSTQRGIITSAYVCIKPTKINSRYLYYLLHAYDLLKVFYNLGGGLRQGMKFDDLKRLPAFDIAPEQQLKIANYLDEETALIDDLIAKQQRLLALLEEKRRATITHAVTRGLNPSVDLKETNIPWLGQVPAHWELRRLKYLFTINNEALSQKTDPETEFEYVDISSVDKYEGIIKREPMTFASAPSRARRVVKGGDIILGAVRTYLEAIAQIKSKDENVIVSTGFAVLRPDRTSDSDFYSWAIRSGPFMASVVASSDGVSYPAINADKLATLYMPLPPKDERDAISKYILGEMVKMDTLKAKIFEQVDLLRERRTSLISHAVTGKIKA